MRTDIPSDPLMLLSFVNTKLRDQYASLDALCDDLQLSRQELQRRLSEVGFEYYRGRTASGDRPQRFPLTLLFVHANL